MPLKEDIEIFPVMLRLISCYERAIAEQGFEEACFVGLLPEGMPAIDYAGECDDGECPGQAWVRLVTGTPYTTTFPAGGQGEIATCRSLIAWNLELGFTHCAPGMGRDGSPPGVAEQLHAVRVQTAAANAMRRAISCCFDGDDDTIYSLGVYDASGAAGSALWATWQVTVGVD